MKNGKPWFKAKRSLQLHGRLFPYKGNTFVVRWDNPQIDAPAFVLFNLDESGKAVAMTMKPLSAQTGPGFDFQDLDFFKVK